MIRSARFAGTWYPSNINEIRTYLKPVSKPKDARAIVCPHAGWIYSGHTAGKVFSAVTPADRYIIISPNHHGWGAPVSVSDADAWETPLGNLEVDTAFVDRIIKQFPVAKKDADAHREEHSIEVLLPFVALINPHARIVPIALRDYRRDICKALGEAIGHCLQNEKGKNHKTLIIASTDMSHFLSAEIARQCDSPALEAIKELDPDQLLTVVVEQDISMCGSGPVATVLWAAKPLGAHHASLIEYTNSSAATGDTSEVVAYAGFVIE